MSDQPHDPNRPPDAAPDSGGARGGDPPSSPDDTGVNHDLVGTVLAGRYRILRRLGDGAMGSVYLGEHLKFGRKDAIKVLQASMARDPEATRRFLRGARNASAINHRNVCTVYDFGDTDDGLQFLAMEFVDGEALSDTLEREGALPPARAVHIIRQVAEALQAAHDLDIVHRDLKPGNIMLARARDGSDLVKVVDFDIAKGSREGEGGEVTRLGFVVGTPEYMSPEQLTGDPLDGRSDVYSMGLVLFRLLTGELPVRAANTQDLLVERLTQEPLTLRDVAPEPEFPPGLQAVLDRALQRRRDDRYPSATAFARDLEGSLQTGGSVRSGATLVGPGAPATPPGGSPPGAGLPATRVSDPAPTPAPPTGRASGPAGAQVRRWVGWGLGAVGVVAAGWLGYTALGGEEAASDDARRDPDSSTVSVVDPRDTVDREERIGASTEDSDSSTDTADVAPRDEPPGDRTDPDTRDTDVREERPVLPFPPDRAGDVAIRQLDRLDAGEPPPALRASADTALLILESDAVARTDRALAAFVLGQLREGLLDPQGAIEALVRAVDLDPDNESYRNYLRALRGGSP